MLGFAQGVFEPDNPATLGPSPSSHLRFPKDPQGTPCASLSGPDSKPVSTQHVPLSSVPFTLLTNNTGSHNPSPEMLPRKSSNCFDRCMRSMREAVQGALKNELVELKDAMALEVHKLRQAPLLRGTIVAYPGARCCVGFEYL